MWAHRPSWSKVNSEHGELSVKYSLACSGLTPTNLYPRPTAHRPSTAWEKSIHTYKINNTALILARGAGQRWSIVCPLRPHTDQCLPTPDRPPTVNRLRERLGQHGIIYVGVLGRHFGLGPVARRPSTASRPIVYRDYQEINIYIQNKQYCSYTSPRSGPYYTSPWTL